MRNFIFIFVCLSSIVAGTRSVAQEISSSQVSTNFRLQVAASGVLHMQASSNLSTNAWVDIAPCLTASNGQIFLEEPLGVDRLRFFRLLIEPSDIFAPNLVRSFPAAGDILGSVSNLMVEFDECINPLTATGISLMEAGPDGRLGSSDDVSVALGSPIYDPFSLSFSYNFTPNLAAGHYRGVIEAPLSDLSGNPIFPVRMWEFRVFSQADFDNDGIPDANEPALGLDPSNRDSDGDGTLDGDEDPDGDGLASRWEIAISTNPSVLDTDSDGWPDGQEDYDMDGLSNLLEMTGPTNILFSDTDGDGFWDGMEGELGSDPLVEQSIPLLSPIKSTETAWINPTVILSTESAWINSTFIGTQEVFVNRGSVTLATPPILIEDSTP